MLGYAARFACGVVSLSYIVQKRCFTVVYVPHNGNDGSARNKAFDFFNRIRLLFAENFFRRLFGFIFQLYIHTCGKKRGGIVVDGLVYRLHNALFKQPLSNFNGGHTNLFRQYF